MTAHFRKSLLTSDHNRAILQRKHVRQGLAAGFPMVSPFWSIVSCGLDLVEIGDWKRFLKRESLNIVNTMPFNLDRIR